LTERYPGFIARQSLIDFCQGEVAKIDSDRNGFAAALNLGGSPEDEEVLNNADAHEIGKQMAFRTVCEWARAHQIPGDKGASEYTSRGG
jgi:hypothetical protein